MKDSFDKDFFKFLAGFAGILTLAIVSILIIGFYEIQNGNISPAVPQLETAKMESGQAN